MTNNIPPDAWAKFLLFLSPDEEQAGQKYEQLHEIATRFFFSRGCSDPTALADETIDRVIRRIYEGQTILNLGAYLRVVARNVYYEYLRKPKNIGEPSNNLKAPDVDNSDDAERAERLLDCMRQCMAALMSRERDILIESHRFKGHKGARYKEKMAERENLSRSGLGTAICRINKKIKKCKDKCLKKKEAG